MTRPSLYCKMVRHHYLETQFDRFVSEIRSVYGVERRVAEHVASEMRKRYMVESQSTFVPSLLGGGFVKGNAETIPCCRPLHPCISSTPQGGTPSSASSPASSPGEEVS